ncbi:MAG: hypothetical protein WA029_00610 [Anaerolineae bacterium]
MEYNVSKWLRYFSRASAAGTISAVMLLMLWAALGQAFDEERLYFYDPQVTPRTVFSDTEVSSVHFDLVGSLAIAAGFSEADAARIQVYSQMVDSGRLPVGQPIYSFTASSFPSAPPISSVMTDTFCPSPSTTAPTVTMGSLALVECPSCFTSRFGPYTIFFHFPHDRPDELQTLRAWAFGDVDSLLGVATFGYSGTYSYTWLNVANLFETTPCFVTTTQTVDTGDVVAGTPPAFGVYLHSLGDNWSHGACIEAADANGLPFAAHVLRDGPNDPLYACRWTSHEAEFGDPAQFPDSNRSFSATLALYQEMIAFSQSTGFARYHPIPLTAQNNYLYNKLYTFAHTSTSANPQPRRRLADDLRAWALQTRQGNPAFWRFRAVFPLLP